MTGVVSDQSLAVIVIHMIHFYFRSVVQDRTKKSAIGIPSTCTVTQLPLVFVYTWINSCLLAGVRMARSSWRVPWTGQCLTWGSKIRNLVLLGPHPSWLVIVPFNTASLFPLSVCTSCCCVGDSISTVGNGGISSDDLRHKLRVV